MISATAIVRSQSIRWHYDLGSLFYRLLWGEHIHHGLWDVDRPVGQAQEQLVGRLLHDVPLKGCWNVLDVGCGLGGTALLLARRYGCRVTGITLSPVQRTWASAAARLRGLTRRARFLTADAETVSFDSETYELVLSIECTEHLFDKERFFRRAGHWLRPGGYLAICAWLASEEAEHHAELTRLVRRVCNAFLCPSLATAGDYRGWMQQAGLQVLREELVGPQVARTWELCMQRVSRATVQWLARLAGREFVAFLDGFPAILRAFRCGAMDYGIFVARRPASAHRSDQG